MPLAFFPVVFVWPKGYDKDSVEPICIEISMSLCHDHKESFKIEHIRGLPSIVLNVCKAYSLALPDMRTAEMRIVPIVPPDDTPTELA